MKSKENKNLQSSKNPRNQRIVQDEMQALEGIEAIANRKVKPKPESAVDIKTYNSIPRNKQGERLTLLHGWEELLEPQRSYKERIDSGKAMREQSSRAEHGKWRPRKNRDSALSLLASQDQNRIKALIPMRYGRMMQSPFAFFRGNALTMASDLAHVPRTKAIVQLSGDCHLSNFGVFATAERNIIFDLNDFDETLPGPFEWDLKRLAASFVVAAQNNQFSKSVAVRCVEALGKTYREKMEELANMSTLEVWYDRVNSEELLTHLAGQGRGESTKKVLARLKEKRSQAAAVAKLTEVVDGRRRIKDFPPSTIHPEQATEEVVKEILHTYADTLWDSRRTLLQRFRFVDFAMKVVGVGSVGTLAFIVLLQGEGGDDDNIFLQIKQASHSILEPYLGYSKYDHQGERVVNGQRVLQAASDLFLGWTTGPFGRHYYVRQLMDVKGSVPIEELDSSGLVEYAEVCARVLARGHARAGDPAVIFGYLGKSDVFDEALAEFALSYAKQNEADHAGLVDAVNKGRIAVAPGL